ncbi:MAG: elongation factor Ts [Gemmatimonadaceae bacterium]|nr:elongation factor Ts [Gemmatimonadaceae bacterium]
MTITAKDVAALRARTGAGIGDCKKALEETGGNIEQAIDLLRKKGIAKAEKRAGRTAAEGQVVAWVADDFSLGAVVELNSETDFVSRNEEFIALAGMVVRHIAEDTSLDGVADITADHALMQKQWHHDAAATLGEVVKQAAGKTGENVSLRRVARFASDGAVGFYRHFNGKIAAMVEIAGARGEAAHAVANTVAEHVAAGVPVVPLAVRKEDVPADVVARERAIFVAQASESGKPEAIVEKMVAGRIEKYFKEVALLDQPWVRDPEKTIAQVVGEVPGASVRRFIRFQMGEA